MDFVTRLSPIDLFIVLVLALGVFAGFTQGIIRYALSSVVVLIAFIIASLLRDPLFGALGFWQAFTPDLRAQIIYLFLFAGLVVAGWFIVRAFYRQTRLPVARPVDEIGGAVLGLLFAALTIVFLMVVMDSYFKVSSQGEFGDAGLLLAFYNAMDRSALVDLFRNTLIPTFGLVARPLVPREIAELLVP